MSVVTKVVKDEYTITMSRDAAQVIVNLLNCVGGVNAVRHELNTIITEFEDLGITFRAEDIRKGTSHPTSGDLPVVWVNCPDHPSQCAEIFNRIRVMFEEEK